GVGGYLYLRGKQPVVPAGPVDTYIDPMTSAAAATITTTALPQTPVDAEQILFEDQTELVAETLFGEIETAAAAPAADDIMVMAEAAAQIVDDPAPVIASVQPVAPTLKPVSKL